MIRAQTITCLAVLLLSLAAHGQASQTSKGYELYSWKDKGHWYYSLLPRTNASKTYEALTAPQAVHRDTAGLKSALRELPKNEQVVWMSDAPITARKSASGKLLNVKHPSRARIKDIKAICARLGINLKLS
jgi:hypothetical protein